MTFDSIGYVPYTTRTVFDFRCQMMYWANDRIRVNFFGAFMGEAFTGKIIDSRENNDDLKSDFDIKTNKNF